MKINLFILTFLFALNSIAQTELKVGDKAPAFILNMQQNSIQSFPMPYLGRIVLMHFWSSTVTKSKLSNKFLNRLAGRYKNALYRNAEGFEVVAVAVQSDKKAWNETISTDSLSNFMNGIAVRGYNDEVCKKFGITSVPKDILIDEMGVIIAIDPRMRDIESALDDRKNFQPVKKEVVGILAQSSNKSELLKFGKLYLFDAYGDSIATAVTNANGNFLLNDIKLNQDFILKVDNGADFITSDPIALYTTRGEHILDGKTIDKGFVFYIPSKLSYKLTEDNQDATLGGGIGQVNVIKNLVFKNNGTELTPKDESELNAVCLILSKNKSLQVDVFTHTDSKADEKAALELTQKQALTIKNYLIKKGIDQNRIKTEAKGKKEPRKECTVTSDCKEEDHKMNRRVEFLVHKG
ncbi:MAG: OmpA family protein [Bacteroidota bacterium]|nr:OmpA family protein [Bacteroidota bacterium]